ncbi:dTDP-4-dehydrorhamnose reductase [Patescibacteria group bacterium]
MEKSKVLILGHKGMLGQELMWAFASTSSRVVGWDIDEIDITDEADVQLQIIRTNPDIIINAAAYTAVDDCETNRDLCFRVNGEAVGYIAKAAGKLGATMIHFSTDYVFSGERKKGYPEDWPEICPINTYGNSKALGEKLLRSSIDKFFLIRTQWLYGGHGQNFVDTMLNLARTHDEISVVNDQFGSPTWVRDLAHATRILLTEKYEFGVYHLVNEGVTSWYDLAMEIFWEKDLPVKVHPVSSSEFPRPAKRPQYSCLLNTRGPRLPNWQRALYQYLVSRD